MKPLPDLTDKEAMAAIGRRSALWSARNKAIEELRDCFTKMQSADFGPELRDTAREASAICLALQEIAFKWIDNETAA